MRRSENFKNLLKLVDDIASKQQQITVLEARIDLAKSLLEQMAGINDENAIIESAFVIACYSAQDIGKDRMIEIVNEVCGY